MRPLSKVAAVAGTIAFCLLALSVVGAGGQTPFGLPSGSGNSQSIQWGTIANTSTTVLLDAGTQQSLCFPSLAGITSIACTTFDAGTTVGLGGFGVLASNDCVRFYPISTGAAGAATVQSTGLIGGPGVAAIDPITEGATYIAVVVDAGGATAGYVSCMINSKGAQQ